MVGAIVEFMVGDIVGALVGAGVDIPLPLTTTNKVKSAILETNILTQESDVTQQQMISTIQLLEPRKSEKYTSTSQTM